MQERYYEQKQITNVEYVNNLIRQDVTLYQHVHPILAKEHYIKET